MRDEFFFFIRVFVGYSRRARGGKQKKKHSVKFYHTIYFSIDGHFFFFRGLLPLRPLPPLLTHSLTMLANDSVECLEVGIQTGRHGLQVNSLTVH